MIFMYHSDMSRFRHYERELRDRVRTKEISIHHHVLVMKKKVEEFIDKNPIKRVYVVADIFIENAYDDLLVGGDCLQLLTLLAANPKVILILHKNKDEEIELISGAYVIPYDKDTQYQTQFVFTLLSHDGDMEKTIGDLDWL